MFIKDLDKSKKLRLSDWPEGVFVTETPIDTHLDEESITVTPEADIYQFVPFFGVRKLVLEEDELASDKWEYVND